MMSERLVDLVSQLSPEEQSAVIEYIEFLKERKAKSPQAPFQAALDEFTATHSELLGRLAQRRFTPLIQLYERNQFRFELLEPWLRQRAQPVP
jgi:hypothetical protein